MEIKIDNFTINLYRAEESSHEEEIKRLANYVCTTFELGKQQELKNVQNMEYVKRNALQKYIITLEELNKSSSPRIAHENIDALWLKAATLVKDSLELTKRVR